MADFCTAVLKRSAIEERAQAMVGSATIECMVSRSNRLMGEDTDQLHRGMDLFDRLEAEYLAAIQ